MSNHDLTNPYFDLINKSRYEYYFTITFKEEFHKGDELNVNEDLQIKNFIKHLHHKLFCKRYLKHNYFLQMILVREPTSMLHNNAHFHGLIATSPHGFTFQRLIQAFQYASKKLYSTTHINNWDIPNFTFNHFQKKYTVDTAVYNKHNPLYDILPHSMVNTLLVNSEDHSFSHNLVPIESKQDQKDIIEYILKNTCNNTDHIAFLQPERTQYFNFSTKQ